MARLATSDTHFGHSNICKFTKRMELMEKAGFLISDSEKEIYQLGVKGLELDRIKDLIVDFHDKWLLRHLNLHISPEDVVYCMGDFSFYKDVDKIKNVINKLNGSWIFLIGNHDNESKLREAVKGTRHKCVGHYHETKINSHKVVLCHYPIEDWNGCYKGSYMFHGHLHGTEGHGNFKVRRIPKRMDVGLDAHPNFGLFNLDKLIEDPVE